VEHDPGRRDDYRHQDHRVGDSQKATPHEVNEALMQPGDAHFFGDPQRGALHDVHHGECHHERDHPQPRDRDAIDGAHHRARCDHDD